MSVLGWKTSLNVFLARFFSLLEPDLSVLTSLYERFWLEFVWKLNSGLFESDRCEVCSSFRFRSFLCVAELIDLNCGPSYLVVEIT